MPNSPKSDLYRRAGINDLAEFYSTKFVSDEVLDERYFKPLDRFDLRFARTMWVYDNVRAGSTVLDLGCGAGMLALLKRKNVILTGVDVSAECALAARRNGYDNTVTAKLTDLPFADQSFDYVVSLDVLGHVGFEEKDKVLGQVKRVLCPGGVTMHGIECTDRGARKDYEEMSPAELRRFIEIDGHVGLEEEQEHGARFRRFFEHVAWEPRYTLCLSSEEFLKQADRYGLNFEADFLDYLRGLSFKERRAFDMAMGYVFGRVSDLGIRLPKAGLYVFLKASNEPLGAFYNEHRDRRALYANPGTNDSLVCLDRNSGVIFDDGWYEPNLLPPIARWMGERGRVKFQTADISEITFDLTTHVPDIRERPLTLEVLLNGERLSHFSLCRHSWLNLRVPVPASLAAAAGGVFELEIRSDRTWQSRPTNDAARDDRELSIAVCNIEIRSQRSAIRLASDQSLTSDF
ncbi:MAG TPA: methyltransferase domain-containing protein [Pyrinomonadaceae bacterium]|nr:methyltransferase domain-containing protein [Pyrinomonadaceae bacterium]